jgi:basic amino acid/polyamine antiporter, APA family
MILVICWASPESSFDVLLFMLFVSLFSAFAPISVVGAMTSIGTLSAFVLVCGGIIIMRRTHPQLERSFRTPVVPLVPVVGLAVNLLLMLGLGWQNRKRPFICLDPGLMDQKR